MHFQDHLLKYKESMMKVTSFYKFFPIKNLEKQKEKLLQQAQSLNIRGLIIIAEEGINATFCGKEPSVEDYKKQISQLFEQKFFWKDSYLKKYCFERLSIKIKKTIINTGTEQGLQPYQIPVKNRHLSPEEWEDKLNKGSPQLLDIRNNYEVELGKFKSAKALDMETFQEFPEKLENIKMDKNKETLIYCTGGIRCEKAIEIMKNKGFKAVYQLEGGILNYLKKFPNSYFEKECFVFDHRVALDQKLKASKSYSLCPHCGQPGNLSINCQQCKKPVLICKKCLDQSPHYKTCSKNCAYHFKAGHKCRKPFKKEVKRP